MPHLPRYNFGIHFLTACTFNRIPYFADGILADGILADGNAIGFGCAQIFCEELEAARQKYAFQVFAFVVMPDHVHLLLWWDTDLLPDLTISKVAWAVKGLSARRMVLWLKESEQAQTADPILTPLRQPRDQAHFRNWQHKIWQQGAGYDFIVLTPNKLREKTTYIHNNPVRAGLVSAAQDYPWSSAGFYFGKPATNPITITPIPE